MNNLVVQLAKAPVLNTVKTRMQTKLTASQALELHEYMTAYITKRLSQHEAWDYQLAVTEPHLFFDELTAGTHIELSLQVSGPLGKRLKAISNQFYRDARASYLILIGSDCPSLRTEHVEKLIQKLDEGADATIMPAYDGGYVALGLCQNFQELFDGINWGGSQVFEQTLAQAKLAGIKVSVLERLHDIDRPEDLTRLPSDFEFEINGSAAR